MPHTARHRPVYHQPTDDNYAYMSYRLQIACYITTVKKTEWVFPKIARDRPVFLFSNGEIWPILLCCAFTSHRSPLYDSHHQRNGADWTAWLPGTCQVGRLVRRPGGSPRQMLKSVSQSVRRSISTILCLQHEYVASALETDFDLNTQRLSAVTIFV